MIVTSRADLKIFLKLAVEKHFVASFAFTQKFSGTSLGQSTSALIFGKTELVIQFVEIISLSLNL